MSELCEKHVEFFGNVALAHCGSTMVVVTDKSIETLMSVVAIFNNRTQNDIVTYIHVQNYDHMKYLQLFKTLLNNPPMDLGTYLVKGENLGTDLNIYENSTLDIVLLMYDAIVSYSQIVPLIWQKLKPTGTVVFKGIRHDDMNKLRELQVLFGNVIPIPQDIQISINVIEGTEDIVIIKKPCY